MVFAVSATIQRSTCITESMTKEIILAALVIAGAKLGAAQEVAYLDLTDVVPRTDLRHMPAKPLKCNPDHTCTGSGADSVSVTIGCGGDASKMPALQANLTWMDRIDYVDGERAEIEVQIENVGEVPIEIPWSPNLSDLQPVNRGVRFRAQNLLIGLFLNWEGASESLGYIYLYGAPEQSQTMLRLIPGQWARVRGPIEIEFDHADGFVLPLPGSAQTASAEIELQSVVYTPAPGGVDLNITRQNFRKITGNVMAVDVHFSTDKKLWLQRLKAETKP